MTNKEIAIRLAIEFGMEYPEYVYTIGQWNPAAFEGHAMELLEKMRERGYHIVIATCDGCMGQTGTWSVDITHDALDEVAMVHDDKFPMAACLATMKMLDMMKAARAKSV